MPARRATEQVHCSHCGVEYHYDRTRRCWSCDGPACEECLSQGPGPLCPECQFDGLALHIEPMLAVDGALPTAGDDWAFEYKWDGVRALCYWSGGRMRLQSRNLNDITGRYPDLAARPEQLGADGLILDGEIIALDASGRPSFHQLQHRMHLSPSRAVARSESVPAYYYVFDLLWREGKSCMDQPYRRRREALESLTLSHPQWRVPPSVVGAGKEMLRVARQWGLEGLIAKRPESLYRPGERSADWMKIKIVKRQEFVIGGWEPRQRNAEEIGSLLVGYYGPRHVGMRFAGRVGTGFSARTHRRLLELLTPRAREGSPFQGRVGGRKARFVKPDLVAEVEYRRWPEGGSIQQASFQGLRDDKSAWDVVLERS